MNGPTTYVTHGSNVAAAVHTCGLCGRVFPACFGNHNRLRDHIIEAHGGAKVPGCSSICQYRNPPGKGAYTPAEPEYRTRYRGRRWSRRAAREAQERFLAQQSPTLPIRKSELQELDRILDTVASYLAVGNLEDATYFLDQARKWFKTVR